MTIEHFKAPASGRIISLNGSLSEIEILEEITVAEMKEMICLYEKTRIE